MRKILLTITTLSISLLIIAACAAGMDNDSSAWVEEPMTWSDTQTHGRVTSPAVPAPEISVGIPGFTTQHEYAFIVTEDAFDETPSLINPINQPHRERMLIRSANISLESDNFDNTVDILRNVTDRFGGFVENSNLSSQEVWLNRDGTQSEILRFFSITLRVPVEHFDSALRHIEGLATVTFTNEHADDVTDRFYDMAGRMESRRVEERRLLELIEEAETITEILALEDRLSQTRTQIEIYRSQMDNLANQAAFSTIHVGLSETGGAEVIVPYGVGGRMADAFGTSANDTARFFQNAVIFMAGAIIPLIIVTSVVILTIVITKTALRHSERKKAAKGGVGGL